MPLLIDVVSVRRHTCPHELQRRISQPITRCVLLLGDRGGVGAPAFVRAADAAAAPPEAAVLLHNLGLLRELSQRPSEQLFGPPSSDASVRFVWVDREKQTDLAAALDKQAGGTTLLAYLEGRKITTLTLDAAPQQKVTEPEQAGRLAKTGLRNWLRGVRREVTMATLVDSDGSRRELGSGRAWVVDEDGPGLMLRVLQLLRIDRVPGVVLEQLAMIDQSQIAFLTMLLWVGYSVSGVGAEEELGSQPRRQRRNRPGRADTQYYEYNGGEQQAGAPQGQSAGPAQAETDAETDADAAPESDQPQVHHQDEAPPSEVAAVPAEEAAGQSAEAAVELSPENIRSVLGPDRYRPLSLQLLRFRSDDDGALEEFEQTAQVRALNAAQSRTWNCALTQSCADRSGWASFAAAGWTAQRSPNGRRLGGGCCRWTPPRTTRTLRKAPMRSRSPRCCSGGKAAGSAGALRTRAAGCARWSGGSWASGCGRCGWAMWRRGGTR